MWGWISPESVLTRQGKIPLSVPEIEPQSVGHPHRSPIAVLTKVLYATGNYQPYVQGKTNAVPTLDQISSSGANSCCASKHILCLLWNHKIHKTHIRRSVRITVTLSRAFVTAHFLVFTKYSFERNCFHNSHTTHKWIAKPRHNFNAPDDAYIGCNMFNRFVTKIHTA